jgi:hypothetical protein
MAVPGNCLTIGTSPRNLTDFWGVSRSYMMPLRLLSTRNRNRYSPGLFRHPKIWSGSWITGSPAAGWKPCSLKKPSARISAAKTELSNARKENAMNLGWPLCSRIDPNASRFLSAKVQVFRYLKLSRTSKGVATLKALSPICRTWSSI